MDRPTTEQEFRKIISDLNHTLNEQAGKYLCGPDSVFSIRFQEIEPPDPVDIEGPSGSLYHLLDPFLRGILTVREYGHLPSDAYRLTRTFSDPVLEALQRFHPHVYDLTRSGIEKYRSLLNIRICLGIIILKVGNRWLLLFGEWYD